MPEVISYNDYKERNGTKAFRNISWQCGDKQVKLQKMENVLMENEKLRMKMFLENEFQKEEFDGEYKVIL